MGTGGAGGGPRRAAALAAIVGGMGGVGAFVVADPASIPPSWVVRLLPGVSSAVDVTGGAAVDLEGAWDLDPVECARIEQRFEQIGGRLVPAAGRACGAIALVPGAGPDEARVLVEGMLRPGHLALVDVEDGSDLMRRLYARVEGGDPRAAELGVSAEIDQWSDPAGRGRSDWFLQARDPNALLRYLAEITRADPALAPDDLHRVALEEREPVAMDGGELTWRTYYLGRAAGLANDDIADAHVEWNSNTNAPDVRLELTDEGGERFGDWTGRVIGRKIAIVLDGTVQSAPLVLDKIYGGQVSITMGMGPPAEIERQARSLASVLKSRPLDLRTTVIVTTARALPPTVSALQLQLARALLALLVGLALALPCWVLERRARPIDPTVQTVSDSGGRSIAWRRAAVTAGAAALAAGAVYVPAPWFGPETLRDLGMAEMAAGPFSVFALGLQPFLTAFVLVEIAALVVPRWRPLRVGPPGARARLGIASAALGILLSLLQATFLAQWYAGLLGGDLSIAYAAVVLAGGATALVSIALVADRHGLVNGFAAVLAGGLALEAIRLAREIGAGDVALAARLALPVGIALTALATSAVLRRRVAAAPARFRMPTAGIVPLDATAAILALLAVWRRPEAMDAAAWLLALDQRVVPSLAILLALSLALSWLFSRPSRLGLDTESIDPAGSRRIWVAFAAATLVSTLYLVALFLLERAIGRWAGVEVPFISTALLTAIAMDLVAEWRATRRRGDLVAIWPLHQVQRAEVLIDSLARSGIDVHARGIYLRSLLNFFGPYVPILLQVPRSQVEEARALLLTACAAAGRRTA